MIHDIKGLQSNTLRNLSTTNHETEGTRAKTSDAGGKENASSSNPVHDVSITDTASKLRELEAKVASQPVVDTQRVENIKQAIADGSFRVNANRTAEKMAEFENLLASKVGDK